MTVHADPFEFSNSHLLLHKASILRCEWQFSVNKPSWLPSLETDQAAPRTGNTGGQCQKGSKALDVCTVLPLQRWHQWHGCLWRHVESKISESFICAETWFSTLGIYNGCLWLNWIVRISDNTKVHDWLYICALGHPLPTPNWQIYWLYLSSA